MLYVNNMANKQIPRKIIPTEIKEHKNLSYVTSMEQLVKEIKSLYAANKEVEFSVTDRWIRIGGQVFNGITRKRFEEIVGLREVENE